MATITLQHLQTHVEKSVICSCLGSRSCLARKFPFHTPCILITKLCVATLSFWLGSFLWLLLLLLFCLFIVSFGSHTISCHFIGVVQLLALRPGPLHDAGSDYTIYFFLCIAQFIDLLQYFWMHCEGTLRKTILRRTCNNHTQTQTVQRTHTMWFMSSNNFVFLAPPSIFSSAASLRAVRRQISMKKWQISASFLWVSPHESSLQFTHLNLFNSRPLLK